jgi:hypothetical protein
MRGAVFLLLGLTLLTGCTRPPPSAYVHGTSTDRPSEQNSLGTNSSGEAIVAPRFTAAHGNNPARELNSAARGAAAISRHWRPVERGACRSTRGCNAKRRCARRSSAASRHC